MSEFLSSTDKEYLKDEAEKGFIDNDPIKMPTPTDDNPVIPLHKTAYGKLHDIKTEKYLVKCGHSFDKLYMVASDYYSAKHHCARGVLQTNRSLAAFLKTKGEEELDKDIAKIFDRYQCMSPCELKVTLGKKTIESRINGKITVDWCGHYHQAVTGGSFSVPGGRGVASVMATISCEKKT